jgi:methionyl-tRNA synthetase
MISIKDFMEIDLRTGRIETAERVPKTDKLMKLTVDLGDETRTLVAGIAEQYDSAELPGKKVIVVANLEPATIRGVESQGMVLAADVDGSPMLATFDRWISPGQRVR